MLTIVPTRSRNSNALRLLQAFKETAVISDLVFAIDFDDVSTYSELIELLKFENRCEVKVGNFKGVNATLNHWALHFSNSYQFIGFMGDDHLPRTEAWDLKLSNAIGENPGIAYGNDLLQGSKLPTAVVISSNIIRALGWMSLPTLFHMYIDNFWLKIGQKLNNANYLPEVIIEHLHFLNGKAEIDQQYELVNNPLVYSSDEYKYKYYLKNHLKDDFLKIKKYCGGDTRGLNRWFNFNFYK